ncbi:MAG: FAD-dependent oxidoreductase [Desulfatibacillaceae bacterium]|nr:FAD-dependent oxidoreductase [Desulfatibacillaceae bacterium]
MASGNEVIVIGGGAAGLNAALTLAEMGIGVCLLEKEELLGGHSGRYACKATDACVSCGACSISRMVQKAGQEKLVRVLTGHRAVEAKQENGGFAVRAADSKGREEGIFAKSLILASGFSPFDPSSLALGYGRFANVISNYELEIILRRENNILRPSNNEPAQSIAFIQCIGSRDAKLGHLWCSQVCCPSSLRMASLGLAKNKQQKTSFFYIDLQNCPKQIKQADDKNLTLIRAIPADARLGEEEKIVLAWMDPKSGLLQEEAFDLVVLSVGITPSQETRFLLSGLTGEDSLPKIFGSASGSVHTAIPGLFMAGCARGPMSIADSIADAALAAWEAKKFMESKK